MYLLQYINNGSPTCFIHVLFIPKTKYYTDIHILNWRYVTVFAGDNSNKSFEKEHFIIKVMQGEELSP